MNGFKINEIFYSLQGEGFFTGVPSVFIRFSGCNLKCPFCDTDHTNGKYMSMEEIIDEANKYPARHIVLTGGEPALFVTEEFIDRLKSATGNFIAIETNGTRKIPQNIDWITMSPKFEFCGNAGQLAIVKCDELKVVYQNQDLSKYNHIEASYRFLQPCDCHNDKLNSVITKQTIETCLKNPEWRISLQIHKYLQIK